MTDIIGSILIGVALVMVWATIHGFGIWFESKRESYRYAKWNDKDIKFITHILRRHKR
jgi:hypothetical protein